MKTNRILILFILLICTYAYSQEDNSIVVEGVIVVDRNDLEGVTVYNHSSSKGTVTDKDGNFSIAVTLNDRIEFAALQFKDFEVLISQEIMDSRKMTIYLIEQVNKLDEVLVLSNNLTGDLDFDVANVKLVNPNLDALFFGLGNIEKFKFSDDHLTGIKNVALNENRIVNGINFVNIFSQLLVPIFKSKKIKKQNVVYIKGSIFEIYSKEYLKQILNIIEEDVVEFVYFVEENNFNFALLEPNREFEFITYIKQQEQLFVNLKYGKN